MSLTREEIEQELKTFEADVRAREMQLSQLRDPINNNMEAVKQLLKLQNRIIESHQKSIDRQTDTKSKNGYISTCIQVS
jgi:hypothetical protein